MIRLVISGGQTGPDQSALRAARRARIATGGYACLGWLVERPDGRGDEPAPWLADYGLVECHIPGYRARRRANVRECDAALLLGNEKSHGSRGLIGDCQEFGKPLYHVATGITTVSMTVQWLRERPGLEVVLVGGNRESASPGIGRRAEAFLYKVFKRMKKEG